MTADEVRQFIKHELKGLWPRWESTEAETRLWMRLLARYAYDVARAALQQAFCEQVGNYHRPLPARFLAKARRMAAPVAGSPSGQAHDPDTNVFIQCTEPPARNANLRGVKRAVYVWPRAKQNDPDYVRACAELMRRRFEHLYSGRWITLIEKPESPTEPTRAQPCTATGRHGAAGRPRPPP
ncbi:MAG: hypothetical protein ACYTAS_14970 [Planctomycetota bacterium]|jgi:hypothetical protein